MFMAQVVATTFSCFIQVAVLNFALTNIKDVCTPHQPEHFTCPGGKVFFSGKKCSELHVFLSHTLILSASVIWGLIGPARIFSPGQVYSGLFWFFLVGAVTPIVFYFAARKWPKSPIKYLMAPLLFGGAASIPPATPLNYLSWGIVGFVFQKYIRKNYFAWWSRLNYLTSSGLDLGLALSTLFIFFAFTLGNVQAPNWWGNNIVSATMDAQDTAVQATVAAGEHFGPAVW
jgi:OPT family oligopeptide transporter